jgi:ribosome recycling factor
MSIVEDVCSELKDQGDQALDALRTSLTRIRTGRANVSILDSIRVDYYGSKSPLNQVATMSVPDARMITIKPFDKSLLSEIEKVLRATSDLGLSPQNDGEKIMLPIPPLTEERRKEFTKLAKTKGEDAKISIRNARRDSNDLINVAKKDGDLPEDDAKKGLDRIQEITNKYVKSVDELYASKEREILEI